MRQQDPDYAALARFRHALRKFLAFSEEAAAAEGLTSQQHQALLAIAGLSQGGALSIGELAEILILRHHSVVELVDRLGKLSLVERMADPSDGRRVLVRLSEAGRQKLQALSETHLKELAAIGPTLSELLQAFRG
ncbi:MarR family winged helix-turn-helix transcriptional regulator [Labrys sp. KB_33_2]|uniref:MarR family winged helix-turn-helix transcriptional regulator n=1 Tax=Labrys sp. KB_33_2 TaxID=3237479 RepID=UPI003F913351